MRESPDEVEQFNFNERSINLTFISMVVSEASFHYVITILLDLIKSYDLVQRDQVIEIFDEKNNVETAGMVTTLLHTSSVMSTSDETKLTTEVNFGLTQGEITL